MSNLHDILNEVIKKGQEGDLKRQKKEWEDNQVRLTGTIYKETRSYSNLIMVAGYAGFFSLWYTLKSSLPAKIDLVVALLLVISLASFVIFEIYKVFLYAIKIKDPSDWLKDAKTYEELNDGIGKYNNDMLKLALSEKKVWAFSFGISVIFGLSGLGVLLYFLLANLYSAISPS